MNQKDISHVENNKMVDVYLNLSVITINESGLNTEIKKINYGCFLNDSTICYLKETLRFKVTQVTQKQKDKDESFKQ